MQIEWFGGLNFSIQFPIRDEGKILLVMYLILVGLLIFALRRSIFDMRKRGWGLFIALGALCIVLSGVVALRFAAPDFQPVPNLPQETAVPAAPLFAAVPILLAGLWLGLGPAVLLSGWSALLQAGLQSGQITQRFEVIVFGLVASYLLQQNYRGKLAAYLRHPLTASLLASLLAWPIMLPSFFVYTRGRALEALNYAWPLFLAALLPTITQGFLSGLVVEVINARWPQLRRRSIAQQDPIWSRTLSRRLLLPFIVFTVLVIIVLVYTTSAVALGQATRQAVMQMARDAQTAARDVPTFFQTGQSLADDLADNPELLNPALRAAHLADALQIGTYFKQLLLVDANGQLMGYAPNDQRPIVTLEEQTLISRTLQSGAPQKSAVFSNEGDAYLSFVAPLAAGHGALVGRTDLQLNPLTWRLRDNLQQTLGAGVGYVVDDQHHIIIHPEPDKIMETWLLDATLSPSETIGAGVAYNDRFPDGTPRLLFVQPAAGSNWTTAIELPRISVLELALQISAPLLLLLLLTLIVASLGILLLTRAITHPIQQLSVAAEGIARGQLNQPVTIDGEDEVGRLGRAFEQMRLSLKARVDDLSLLLDVTRSVAASLDLEQGVPPLLEGARHASPARVARLILLDDHGDLVRVISRGEGPQAPTQLDRAVVKLTAGSDKPILLDNVTRARSRAMIDPTVIGPGLKAIASFPVRRQTRPVAVLWAGYAEPHAFAESEVSVLATIAGQAAVLIENVRLYEQSEGERRQLEAVLISTSDAVIVTDKNIRVVLCNPAAEAAFELAPQSSFDKPVAEVWSEPAMHRLFALEPGTETRTEEVLLSDGRTLYGSASGIINSDGEVLGRVAVLRDITHLKELDMMKSEFVATVSHDLRAPLTYMRGYATMLPMVGPLTPKQQDYTEKVMAGIEQMTDLIDDLLDLGRIEAGVGMVREACALADIARSVVETMRPQALSRGILLRTGLLSERVIYGDQGLLKHALTNLVDNAIKYTPVDGVVTVSVQEQDMAMVIAVKDTGIGIAASDQAHLFERFYRVKRRETVDIKGTGLGLAIVKSIAEWHRGRVWVESQIGDGATFYILVPFGQQLTDHLSR
jgi:two-component system, OmpR family, phosphate regulon sensor histidine kinase PhoR